jgi:hypothetical protein
MREPWHARRMHSICDAIRQRRRLLFDYDGLPRVVEPYCHGTTAQGSELLRAVQVGGTSSSGAFGFGKLWTVSKMSRVRSSDDAFAPSDPHYNPDDSAITTVHCRI